MTRRSGKGRKNAAGKKPATAKESCGVEQMNTDACDVHSSSKDTAVESDRSENLTASTERLLLQTGSELQGGDELLGIGSLSLEGRAATVKFQSPLQIQSPKEFANSSMIVTPVTNCDPKQSPAYQMSSQDGLYANNPYSNIVSPQQYLPSSGVELASHANAGKFASLQVLPPSEPPSVHSTYASMQGHIIPNYRGFGTAAPYQNDDRNTKNHGADVNNDFMYKSVVQKPLNTRPSPARRHAEPIDGYIYQVQFKRAHKNFVLSPSAPTTIIAGDFVKVEADRGEDMGIVLSKTPARDFEEVLPTAGYRGRGFSSGQGERKFLYRLATAEERAALVKKVDDEEQALQIIREKVQEQQLPMKILDAEYQFDRHKLTFFFEASRRIDFRELVSELFSLYKTRIWMQQVDTSVLGMHDAGTELARATGFLRADPQYSMPNEFNMKVQHDEHSWNNGNGTNDHQKGWMAPIDVSGRSYDVAPVLGPLASNGGVFTYQQSH